MHSAEGPGALFLQFYLNLNENMGEKWCQFVFIGLDITLELFPLIGIDIRVSQSKTQNLLLVL